MIRSIRSTSASAICNSFQSWLRKAAEKGFALHVSDVQAHDGDQILQDGGVVRFVEMTQSFVDAVDWKAGAERCSQSDKSPASWQGWPKAAEVR